MKRFIISWLVLTLFLLCGYASAEAQEFFESEGWRYTLRSDGSAEIVGDYWYKDADYDNLPTELDGHIVTAIGDFAFSQTLTAVSIPNCITDLGENPFADCVPEIISVPEDHPTLRVIDGVLFDKRDGRLIRYPYRLDATEYSIPQGVRSIDSKAFFGCANLLRIDIPDSVEKIGSFAFENNFELSSITIPDSVVSIGDNPFLSCTSLTEIVVSADQPALAVIDGILYSKADKRLVYYPSGLQKEFYTIPEGIITVGAHAFNGNPTLCEVDIPDSVKEIGDNAFRNCFSLTGTELPDGLTRIGECAFTGCHELFSIVIPGGIKTIDDHAFQACIGLRRVTLNEGVEKVGEWTFADCNILEEISLPNSLTAIGENAFTRCKELAQISLPQGITTLGRQAFSSCASLTRVDIPDTVVEIPEGVFWNCGSLEALTVSPDNPGLAVIDGALYSKADKKLLLYPAGLTRNTFQIPEGIRIIGTYAIGNNSLEQIVFPNTVTTIDPEAIVDCINLMDISLPEGLETIGDEAFRGSIALTEIRLPDSLTAVGANPFMQCPNLVHISVSPDHTQLALIDGVLFSKTDKRLICCPEALRKETYEIPEGIRLIGEGAFYGNRTLAELTVPESVEEIGQDAFKECYDISLIVPRNSVAVEYCKKYGLEYNYTDANNWLND